MKPPSILDDSEDHGIFGDLPSVATQPRDGTNFSPVLKILLGVPAVLAILFVPIIGLIFAALIVICWLLWRIANRSKS